MARSKRKAADDAHSKQRCVMTRRTCSQLQLPSRQIEADHNLVHSFNSFLNERYNLYLPFVQDLAAGDKARVAATRVQKRLDKVQMIWKEAAAKTWEEARRLEVELGEYHDRRRERLHWWRESNIFSLSLSEIIETFKGQEPPRAECLYIYLRSCLKDESLALQEDKIKGYDHQYHKEQAKKARWLLRYLSRLPDGRRQAIQAHAFYVTHFLRYTSLERTAYEKVYDRLNNLLVEHHAGSGEIQNRWSSGTSFLDLASLYRELDEVHQATDCTAWDVDSAADDDFEDDDSEDGEKEECFHKWTWPIMDLLQQNAWKEVQTKVMLTAGKLLPMELAEQVVDCALIAEGLLVEEEMCSLQVRWQQGLEVDRRLCRPMQDGLRVGWFHFKLINPQAAKKAHEAWRRRWRTPATLKTFDEGEGEDAAR